MLFMMLDLVLLEQLARARVDDAEALRTAGRHDGAIYICGYALEIALKARICRTLGWAGFPETRSEFNSYRSFRTHDLDVLLHLSGIEKLVKSSHLTHWSSAASWDPEARYKPIGSATDADVAEMVSAVNELLGVLL
jgi:hypothetical protein